jgi:parvulin-like peptidyl-prolyl isomerase
MKPPKLKTLPLSCCLLFVVASARAEVLERVIVKVNGDIVTQSDFEGRQVAAVQQARINADQIPNFLRENNARILQEAIDDLLLVQRAEELGMRRPEAMTRFVSEFVERIKKENKIADDQALQEQLRREGMTLDDLKRNIERSILRQQVLARELEAKIAVPEADLKAEYESHKDGYTQPARVHLQEIVLKGDGAKQRAAELSARVKAGEDFAALARAHSASATAASGGDLGALARSEMNAELGSTAFAMTPGQISEPLKTSDGYRILKLVDRTEGSVTPFEQVRGELRDRINQERWSKEYEHYLEGLRKDAVIDVRVREVPLKLAAPPPATLLEVPPLDVPSSAAPGATPAVPDDAEIVTSPQTAPQRVQPAGRPAPAPTPTPSPQPEKKKDEQPPL